MPNGVTIHEKKSRMPPNLYVYIYIYIIRLCKEHGGGLLQKITVSFNVTDNLNFGRAFLKQLPKLHGRNDFFRH